MNKPKEKPHAARRGVLADADSQFVSPHDATRAVEAPPALAAVPARHACEMIGDQPALIPPGKYQLRMTHWETGILWGRSKKLTLHFSVCSLGDYFGVKLARHYNVSELIGKPGKYGRFKSTWKQDFAREYCTLFPAVKRADRIDLDRLAHHIVCGLIGTVTQTAKQRAIAPSMQYSVVRELLSLDTGA